MTNNERQTRYLTRLKEAAFPDTLAAFLVDLRQRNQETKRRIEMLRAGFLAYRSLPENRDLTPEAIGRSEAEVAANERILDYYHHRLPTER